MCFCGDPCKVDIFQEEETFRQRYWMCANYVFDPTPQQIRIGLLTPPPLCDFEQWIDTEIKKKDKDFWDGMNQWDAEINERFEMRRKQEAAKKSVKRSWRGGVLLRQGRRGRRSWSVLIVRKKH